MQPISLSVLTAVFDNMAGRVTYCLGAKAPGMDCDSSSIHEIDCSGFVRYALAKSSGQEVILPDGSFYQRQWCQQMGLHRLGAYGDVQYAIETPNRLFICFIEPNAQERIGHVWLVRACRTLESHSPNGVSTRAWDTPVLKEHASAAFELQTAE